MVDLSGLADDLAEDNEGVVPDYATGPIVFVNPEIVLDEDSDRVDHEEGCLSIPDLRETVWRPDRIRVRYLDRTFRAARAGGRGGRSRA